MPYGNDQGKIIDTVLRFIERILSVTVSSKLILKVNIAKAFGLNEVVSSCSKNDQVVPKNSPQTRSEKRFASPSASHFFPNGARHDHLTSVKRP